MKKWKCTVCGYVHTGPQPPEECPVCGAPKEKFVEISEEEAGSEYGAGDGQPAADPPSGFIGFIFGQVSKHHAHPISVHTPNGILPLAVVFLVLSVVFQISCMAEAAFFSIVFVVLSMPAVLFSGYVDWKVRFGGVMTSVILTKMVCGAIVLLIGIVLVLWRLAMPEVADPESMSRWLYLLVHLAMLGPAGLAGFLGGRLVFGE